MNYSILPIRSTAGSSSSAVVCVLVAAVVCGLAVGAGGRGRKDIGTVKRNTSFKTISWNMK